MCGTEHMTTPRKAKVFARTWPDRLKAGWRAGEWHPLDRKRFWPHPIYRQQEAPNESTRRADSTRGLLRHALLHRQGQEKSKDFYVRILGGKVIKAENPCYVKLAN